MKYKVIVIASGPTPGKPVQKLPITITITVTYYARSTSRYIRLKNKNKKIIMIKGYLTNWS